MVRTDPPREESVLVTGTSGFIAQHVARACCRAGMRVTALDHRSPMAGGPNAGRFLHADFAHPEVLGAVRRGVFSAVIHHAGISSTVEDDWSILERTNVVAPLELAAACAVSGTKFIYASSSSVYGRITRRVAVRENPESSLCSGPLNMYARSKLLLDQELASRFPAGDLDWVGLRYTNVFGAGESHKGPMASIISQLLRQAAEGDELRLFADSLEASRDYIPVSIVAETCVALLRTWVSSGVYNLGSGHPVSFARIVNWCAEFSDGPVVVRLVANPLRECYQYWTCADMSKLDSALPGRAAVEPGDIRLASHTLYDSFAGKASVGEDAGTGAASSVRLTKCSMADAL
jgi:ADP-L-glycero-D-manno-heptose 6-epimerase